MERIDTSRWREFRVGDLFDIHPTQAYKLTNAQILDDGDTPVAANSAYNNGIGGYSTKKPTEKGNMVTFSDTVDANTIFYQPDDFIGYPHVQGLYPIGDCADRWGQFSYLFFVSIFRKAALTKGFDYGNKFRRDIAVDLLIKLPATANGQPDYTYMDQYMRDVMIESEASLENLRQADNATHLMDTQSWKPFCLGDLFDVVKGTRLTKADQRDGDINFISASSFNNGIAATISNDEHVHPGNTMTVSYNGSDIGRTFYQEEPFWASDDVNVLYPKFKLTKNIALFIAPIIKAVGGSHVYKNKWLQEDMKVAEIMLPVTTDGNPDWDYMENSMSEMLETTSASFDVLAEVAS